MSYIICHTMLYIMYVCNHIVSCMIFHVSLITICVGVCGMADLLSQTTLTPEQADYVNCIQVSGDHLRTIIRDVSNFACMCMLCDVM